MINQQHSDPNDPKQRNDWLGSLVRRTIVSPSEERKRGQTVSEPSGSWSGSRAIKKFSIRRSLPEHSPTTPRHLARPGLRLVNIHRRGEAHSLRAGGGGGGGEEEGEGGRRGGGGGAGQMGEARLVGKRNDEAKGETDVMWPDYKDFSSVGPRTQPAPGVGQHGIKPAGL